MHIPKFHPGQIVATPGALAALQEAGESPLPYLQRHLSGDWGDVDPGASAPPIQSEAVAEEARQFLDGIRAQGSDTTDLWSQDQQEVAITTIGTPVEAYTLTPQAAARY